MADPVTMGVMAIGSSVVSGIAGVAGAQTTAAGQQNAITGQILSTIGKAFSFDVQAQDYGYRAQMDDYQAAVADLNAKIAKQNADYSIAVGEAETSNYSFKIKADLGMATAQQGASGIDVNTGSSVRVRQSIIDLGYHDESTIRSNYAKVAYGYEVERTQDEAQSALYHMGSDLNRAQAAASTTAAQLTRQGIPLEQTAYGLAGQAGTIGAIGSIAGSAGSVASKWLQGQQQGIWGGGSTPSPAPVGGD